MRIPAMISSERESAGVSVLGIDPTKERDISFIGQGVARGRNLSGPDDAGLVVGEALLEQLNTKLGRRVVLMGHNADLAITDRGFRILGVFDAELESTEKAYVFTGYSSAQDLFGLDQGFSEISALTDDYRDLDGVKNSLASAAKGKLHQ